MTRTKWLAGFLELKTPQLRSLVINTGNTVDTGALGWSEQHTLSWRGFAFQRLCAVRIIIQHLTLTLVLTGYRRHTEPDVAKRDEVRGTAIRTEGLLQLAFIVRHKPLLTRSGYWSTLHPDGPSFRVFAKQMTNSPAACDLTPKSTIGKSATTKSVQDDATRGETPK